MAGDGLFIPSMWFHHVRMTSCGVAINAFWHCVDKSLLDPKDVYGNRDPVPAQRAIQTVPLALGGCLTEQVQRVRQQLEPLPPHMQGFYLRRLAQGLLADAAAAEASQ